MASAISTGSSTGPIPGAVTSGISWPTYLGSVERLSASVATWINVSNAPSVSQRWNFTTGGEIAASPAIVNNVVYIGSWDGYEYALNATTGKLIWKHFLGINTAGKKPIGITSSAAFRRGTIYVGGGSPYWYALNAGTGQTVWKVFTGNASMGYYNWASPLVVAQRAYIGIASRGDHPLVLGGLLDASILNHHVVARFNTSTNGTLGGSIWTSPAYDPSTGQVYVTTGNPGANGTTYADSLIDLDASRLALKAFWRTPSNQTPFDSDFGGTPMVFHPVPGPSWVAASNKNGHLYVFNTTSIGGGPVWTQVISNASTTNGTPNLGPLSWGDHRIYVGTSLTVIGNATFNGSVRAFVPTSGKRIWTLPESAPVLGAPVFVNGVLIVPDGHALQLLDARNGSLLTSFAVQGSLVSAPAVGAGEIVVGSTNGTIYAFAPPLSHGPGTGAPRSTSIEATGPTLAAATRIEASP